MNKDRRKEIADLIETLAGIAAQIEDAKGQAESIRDEEQDYLDNMPEGFRYADRGYAAEEAVGNLDEVVSALEDFDLDSIQPSLEAAAE